MPSFIDEATRRCWTTVCKHLRKSFDKPTMDRRECLNHALLLHQGARHQGSEGCPNGTAHKIRRWGGRNPRLRRAERLIGPGDPCYDLSLSGLVIARGLFCVKMNLEPFQSSIHEGRDGAERTHLAAL